MKHIRTRKHAPRAALSQPGLATATLLTGLAFAAPATAAADLADSADAAEARRGSATTLDGIEVKGVQGYRAERLASPKFTQTLQDTPQTVQVIAKELFNEQGATTLTEALRNSAGVGTFYAGENGNTATGDTLYMRGFDSSSSIFVDGARDLGSISRDLFNIEQVEVVKGPAGTDTGRSAPTGAINMVSKEAGLHDAASATLQAGSDGQQRATADWNQTLGASSALRVNAMRQDSDVPGRDRVNNSRWGIAPSLGLGLGGGTRFFANLLYVKQDNVPDGFVPTIGLPGWRPQPGLEQLAGHPVNPENFYGTRDDHDDVTVQMGTLRLEHDFSETLRLSNTLRWGKTEQDYLLTAFMGTGGTAANPQAGNIRWTDRDDLSTYTLVRSNPTVKDQRNEILTNHLNLRADFATGGVEHFLSAGLELTRERQHAYGVSVANTVPPASLYDPDWNVAGPGVVRNGADSDGETRTAALYLFDTLEFNEHFLLSAALRADRYTTEFQNAFVCGVGARPQPCPAGVPAGTVVVNPELEAEDTLLNYKVGAVYKPTEAVSLYANVARSQQPPGGNNFSLSTSASSLDNPNLEPQDARTVEVGTKWMLADNRLSLNLALFRTTVGNEITGSAAEGYFQDGEKQVEGVEISAVGNITDNWNLSLGFLHQDAQVTEGAPVTADGTPNLTYTPEDAFTSWTTYRFPFGLTVGGGVRYTGGLHKGTDGAVGTPAYTKSWTVWDAMVSYPVGEHLVLRLNGYNLFDKQYVASINKSGYRYTPGTPRTFLLSAEFRF